LREPTVKVPNWGTFQHYKDRSPPWIKLHRQLLNNRHWNALSDGAGKLLPELWLVAAESDDGSITASTEDLAWRLRRDPETMAALLIELERGEFLDLSVHDASIVIAGCLQDASTEGEGEAEREQIKTTAAVVEEKFEDQPHTASSLALEANEVLGMRTWWRSELDAKYRETKSLITRHWGGRGKDLAMVYAAIHGLRILVDRGDVEWLADRKRKPLDGLHVLTNTRALIPGFDGQNLRGLFDASVDAYYRQGEEKRPPTLTSGPTSIRDILSKLADPIQGPGRSA
jgi:hypothetical protein